MKNHLSSSVILAAAAALLFVGAGCTGGGDYRAFIYKDRVEYAFNPARASVQAAGPAFKNAATCESWASKESIKAGNVPYRCGYHCRYEQKYGEVVCEDDPPVVSPLD